MHPSFLALVDDVALKVTVEIVKVIPTTEHRRLQQEASDFVRGGGVVVEEP